MRLRDILNYIYDLNIVCNSMLFATSVSIGMCVVYLVIFALIGQALQIKTMFVFLSGALSIVLCARLYTLYVSSDKDFGIFLQVAESTFIGNLFLVFLPPFFLGIIAATHEKLK